MNAKNYLIIGGTGGIGKAMIEQLTGLSNHKHASNNADSTNKNSATKNLSS